MTIDGLREKHGKRIPDLPYAQLCDWPVDRLREEFPRYAMVEPTEDARDGETFGIRMVIESPYRPEIQSRYFEVMEILPSDEVYGGPSTDA